MTPHSVCFFGVVWNQSPPSKMAPELEAESSEYSYLTPMTAREEILNNKYRESSKSYVFSNLVSN